MPKPPLDSSHDLRTKIINGQYTILDVADIRGLPEGYCFENLTEQDKAAIRWGLNYYQVQQIKNDYRHPLYAQFARYLSKLNARVEQGFLCFSHGNSGWVRANFFVDGTEPMIALMQIDGFSEIISRFMEQHQPSLYGRNPRPTYRNWTPVATEWGVQIRVS